MAAKRKRKRASRKVKAPRQATEKPKRTKQGAEPERVKDAAEHFVRGVITRGEAAKPVAGELPPGATHEIVEENEGELPKIKRRRFSLF